MKQFFKIALIALAMILTVAPMSDAKVKKNQKKGKSATTNKWVEAARSDNEVWYMDLDVSYDEEGCYYVNFKVVPKKASLAATRKMYMEAFESPKYKDYTHSINQYKIDFSNNSWIFLTGIYYSNNTILDLINEVGYTEWDTPKYGSVGYECLKTARMAIKGY